MVRETHPPYVEEEFSISAPFVLTIALGFILLLMANTAGAGEFRWRFLLYFALVFLLCAYVLFLHLSGKKPLADKGFLSTLAVFAGLLVLEAISLAWGRSLYHGIQQLLLTGSFILAFILGFLMLRSREKLWIFMGLVVTASISLCVYGLLQYFFLFNDLVEFMLKHGLDYTITNRINSRFLSPNVFAGFLDIAIPLTVALLLIEKRKALAWTWGGALTLQLVCLYLTQSRGGWLVFALVAVLLAITIPGKMWKNAWKILALSLLLAVVFSCLCSLYDPVSNSAYSDKAGEARYENDYSGLDVSVATRSVSSRVGIWRGALDMFRDNLAGGVGAGSFGLAVQQYQNGSYFSVHASNYLLETAAEVGIVGLILLLILTLLVLSRIRAVFRLKLSGDLKAIAWVFWVIAVGFFTHNLLDVSWYNQLAGTVLWLCAGALFAITATGPREDGETEAEERQENGGTIEEDDTTGKAKWGGAPGTILLAVTLTIVVVAAAYLLTIFFLSETRIESGDSQKNFGDVMQALKDYEGALEYYEANPEVHRKLGSLYLDQYVLNKQELAGFDYATLSMQHLDRAIELEPENSTGHLSKGLLLLNQGLNEAGRLELDEVQRLYPNSPAAFYFEGESYLDNDLQMALQKYQEALDLLPYYANQNIMPYQEGPEFKFLFGAAQRMMDVYLYLGEPEKALQTADFALRELPDKAWLHSAKAAVLEEMGELEGALEELKLSAKLDPKTSGIYLSMGRIYKELGDLQKAEEMFRAELELDPQNEEAQKELSSITGGG